MGGSTSWRASEPDVGLCWAAAAPTSFVFHLGKARTDQTLLYVSNHLCSLTAFFIVLHIMKTRYIRRDTVCNQRGGDWRAQLSRWGVRQTEQTPLDKWPTFLERIEIVSIWMCHRKRTFTFKTIIDPYLVEIEFQVWTFLDVLASLEPTLLS